MVWGLGYYSLGMRIGWSGMKLKMQLGKNLLEVSGRQARHR